MAFYEEDLATIHDAGYGEFARQAAEGLVPVFRRAGFKTGRVVELGCGSGISTEIFARQGYQMTGIDQSSAMIARARVRVPGGSFRVGSIQSARLPICEIVTALGEVVCYQSGADRASGTLERLIERVSSALVAGGLFVFDVVTRGRAGTEGQATHARTGPDWAVIAESVEKPEQERLIRSIVSFRRVGKHYRRHEERHELKLYRAKDVCRWLRDRGFRVSRLGGYGDQNFAPGLAGFLARRV